MYIKGVKNKRIVKNQKKYKNFQNFKIIKIRIKNKNKNKKEKEKIKEEENQNKNYSKLPSMTPSFSWSSSYDEPISSPVTLSNWRNPPSL